MSWNGAWFGQWFGEWQGALGEDDGSVHGWSLQTIAITGTAQAALEIAGASVATLDATSGVAAGNGPAAAVSGASAVEIAATYGEASGALQIAGASDATLGDAVAGEVVQVPPRVSGGGLLRPRFKPSRLPVALVGASAGVLDDVAGNAAGEVQQSNVVTLRQRQGRRDDRDLMVSGWR